MSYLSPNKKPFTSEKKSQPLKKSPVRPSKHSFPDFDFDEEEDDYSGINPLMDVDFTDLELDSQEEFTYQEEKDLYLDDEEDQEFDEEEE